MLVNDDSRLILFPKDVTGSYEYVAVGNDTFVLQDLQLYELRAIETNEFPSSFVIELENDKGCVMNNTNHKTIVATKYNLNYKLLLVLQDVSRGKSMENLIDDELSTIVSTEHKGIGIPVNLIEQYLQDETLWDVITEGEESYYRYNKDKCLKWLQDRVDKLTKFHLQYSYSSIIRSLKKDYEQVTDAVVELYVRRFAVDFITHAYALDSLNGSLSAMYDFKPLDDMVNAQKELLKQRNLVEANLRTASDNSNQKKRPGSAAKLAPSKKIKKVPKVAVGKGALDNFFKKS